MVCLINPALKAVLTVMIAVGICVVTIYLIRTAKGYVSENESKIGSFIDFVITEDTAFEVLFILLIVLIIVLFK